MGFNNSCMKGLSAFRAPKLHLIFRWVLFYQTGVCVSSRPVLLSVCRVCSLRPARRQEPGLQSPNPLSHTSSLRADRRKNLTESKIIKCVLWNIFWDKQQGNPEDEQESGTRIYNTNFLSVCVTNKTSQLHFVFIFQFFIGALSLHWEEKSWLKLSKCSETLTCILLAGQEITHEFRWTLKDVDAESSTLESWLSKHEAGSRVSF